MRFALVTGKHSHTNAALARASPAWVEMTPHLALEVLSSGDAALGRLDVVPELDGVDDGLWALGALAARGVVVLNEASALLATHDKLLTARLLRRHGVSHPWTMHIREGRQVPAATAPVVIKPRFGSCGKDVYRCDRAGDVVDALAQLRARPWFREHGALLQELVEPRGYDLRIVVAGDCVVGAVYRVAARGEWRTNVALGATRRPVEGVPVGAAALAIRAAQAASASLVGVDLLPDGRDSWTVLELNGAVEFTPEYAPWGDIYDDVARRLESQAREMSRAGVRTLVEPATFGPSRADRDLARPEATRAWGSTTE